MTESKGQSFWATLPGLVTAIAGMVTAIAILVTTLANLPGSQPQPSTAPASEAAPSGNGPPPSSADVAGSPAASVAAPVTLGQRTRPAAVAILFYAVRMDPDTAADNADLYSVDPETGVERRVTTDPRPDSYPASSPDGRRIAFDSRRGGGNRDIWVLEADGSYTPLTADARDDAYATWSPDGSQVAWSAGSAGQREIWVMSAADGSGARRLTTGADDLLPSWSSSGLVAFERHAGTSSEIWVVDPSGGGASARDHHVGWRRQRPGLVARRPPTRVQPPGRTASTGSSWLGRWPDGPALAHASGVLRLRRADVVARRNADRLCRSRNRGHPADHGRPGRRRNAKAGHDQRPRPVLGAGGPSALAPAAERRDEAAGLDLGDPGPAARAGLAALVVDGEEVADLLLERGRHASLENLDRHSRGSRA